MRLIFGDFWENVNLFTPLLHFLSCSHLWMPMEVPRCLLPSVVMLIGESLKSSLASSNFVWSLRKSQDLEGLTKYLKFCSFFCNPPCFQVDQLPSPVASSASHTCFTSGTSSCENWFGSNSVESHRKFVPLCCPLFWWIFPLPLIGIAWQESVYPRQLRMERTGTRYCVELFCGWTRLRRPLKCLRQCCLPRRSSSSRGCLLQHHSSDLWKLWASESEGVTIPGICLNVNPFTSLTNSSTKTIWTGKTVSGTLVSLQ